MKIAGRKERKIVVIEEGKFKGKEAIVLKKLERQLIIYKFLASGRLLEKDVVLHLYGIPTSTIYKDLQDIADARQRKLVYDEARKLYEESDEAYAYNDMEDSPNRRAHINRLSRLIWCMRFLYNEAPTIEYDEEDRPYIMQGKSCREYYREQYPDVSVRNMNRDFETLTNIGYVVRYNRKLGRYDFFDDDYYSWEDFPWFYEVIYSKKYGLCRLTGEEYDMPLQDNLAEEAQLIKEGRYEW